MRDVLERTLEMALSRSGLVELRLEKTPLASVARQAIELVAPAAGARRQRIQMAAEDDVAVDADPVRLREVLVNLLDNAIRYSPEHSEIRLVVGRQVKDERPRGFVSVIDQGPGIAPEEQSRIFEPFQRGTAGRGGGVGLGLAIARALVQRMGGELLLYSKPGEGATFTVLLPLAR